MGFGIEFDVPANGRLRQATATLLDDEGKVVTTDKVDLESMKDRSRLAKAFAPKACVKPKEMAAKIEAKCAEIATERRKVRDDGDDGDDESEDKGSHATILVALAMKAGVRLFHDAEQRGFATLPIGNRIETWPLRSTGFRRYLSLLFHRACEKTPGGQAVADAIAVLEGKAVHDSPEYPVHVRLAEHEGKIYLDLADKDWNAVEVDVDGWRIIKDPPVKFRRPRGLMPLPIPRPGGRVDDLRRFVNVEGDDDWRLVVGWEVQAFRPRGPYPVLCLHGEQGCGKSTKARALRSLLDPSTAPLRSEPREPRDLMIAATNAWAVAFDNLSHLPDWLSDALCRLATGGGFSTRELFTDAEEMIFDAMRPCALTSIEDLASRGDLLERSIIIRLPRISEQRRRTERQFWTEFEQARPAILGALLDAVSAALARVDTITLDAMPRMADFAVWVTAAEPALGWAPGAFLTAYRGNQRDANELALEASPIVVPLRKLMEQETAWEGTAGDLLEKLAALAGEKAVKEKEWPKRANVLSGKLRRLAPNLAQVGVGVDFERQPGGRRSRTIRLTRTQENERETSSLSSRPSRDPENPEQSVVSGDDPGTITGTQKPLEGTHGTMRDDLLQGFSGQGDDEGQIPPLSPEDKALLREIEERDL
jgi:hypothetical protein